MFFTQLGYLFSNMQWYVLVLFIVGLTCLLLEFLQPGFGVFGITGIIFLVLSIVFRAVFAQAEDYVLMQIFQFLLIDVLIIGVLLVLVLVAQKKGLLKKGIFNVGTCVDPTYSNGTKDYSFLVGKQGKTLTVLRPSGKAEIDGAVYDVLSEEFWVENGESIVVSFTEGGKIVVKQIK